MLLNCTYTCNHCIIKATGMECKCCSKVAQMMAIALYFIQLFKQFVWIHGFCKKPATATDSSMEKVLLNFPLHKVVHSTGFKLPDFS